MSRKKDYTRFSEEPREVPVEVVEEVVEEIEEVEVVEAPKKPLMGIVTDCARLNVRENPNPNARIICTVDASADLMIEEENSTNEFYKVYTADGIEGYCMKKFVTVKP